MSELLIINPSRRPSKRKGAKKTMAKKRRSAAQVAATKRLVALNKSRRRPARKAQAKKRRRNPASVVYAGTKKPVSRKVWADSGYRRNPARRSKRRRNPAARGGMLGNIVNKLLIPAATAAAGAVALDVAYGFLPIPAALKTGPMRHAVKGVGAVALGMVAGMVVKKDTADQLAAGAMTVVMYNAYRDILARVAPGVALGAYLEEPIPAGNGMGAYLEGNGVPALQFEEDVGVGGNYDLGETYNLGQNDYNYT